MRRVSASTPHHDKTCTTGVSVATRPCVRHRTDPRAPRHTRWAMTLPFTTEQFHGVFHDDNVAVWPMQWILVALAAPSAA